MYFKSITTKKKVPEVKPNLKKREESRRRKKYEVKSEKREMEDKSYTK